MDPYKDYDEGKLLNDRYSKLADISEGSYGLVSVAKDVKKSDTLVAVKFIYPLDYKRNSKEQGSRPSSSPAKLKSPVRSSKRNKNSVLQSLYEEAFKEISVHNILGEHANIASLYDHFDSFLILEYCSRGDLYEAIQNGQGPTTSQDIKDVFQQILNAVEYCHSLGVYHRDLKPENILISDDWSIKLCDWGLATTTKCITNKNEFDVGSERYMAPELFDSNIKSYDASKIDIWSIGIILLTLVFHKNPFNVANCSDKRFIQFSNNREALFDFFSTMSGEMFSVLRFCLNLDPDNRHIRSLKDELKTLKYFTIDEEYWASDYDEDIDGDVEDDFDFFNDDEDYYYKKSQQSVSVSPIKQDALISKSEIEVKPLINEDNLVESPPSTTESDTTNSKSNFSKTSNHSDETSIPHNHRADALLSSNTELKPIPIGDSNLKIVRNTRKPFNVASYNHSQSSKMNNHQNSKYIREDFFTPKSVFNHYMAKYGEQRQPNASKGQSSGSQQWKKKRRNRFWKNRKGYPNSQSKGKSFARNGVNESSQNGHQFGRKKSNSFSTSKSRKSVNGNGQLSNSLNQMHMNVNGNHVPSSIPSTAPLTGKYVPPFLRSPNHNKSPMIEPLTEEIDRLALDDDYDEVFHLEGDFNESNDNPNNVSHMNAHTEQYGSILKATNSNMNDHVFKKPQIKVQGIGISNSSLVSNGHPVDSSSKMNGKDLNGHSSNSDHTRRHSATFVNGERPMSNGSYNLGEETSRPQKYVPPFRRRSSTSKGHGQTSMAADKIDKKKIDNFQSHFEHHDKHHTLTSTSVPTTDVGWQWLKKDWSEYDA